MCRERIPVIKSNSFNGLHGLNSASLVFHLDGPFWGCCSHVVAFPSDTPRVFLTQGFYCALPPACNAPPPGLRIDTFFSAATPYHIILFYFFIVLISTWHYSFFLFLSTSGVYVPQGQDIIVYVLPTPSRFSMYNCLVSFLVDFCISHPLTA